MDIIDANEPDQSYVNDAWGDNRGASSSSPKLSATADRSKTQQNDQDETLWLDQPLKAQLPIYSFGGRGVSRQVSPNDDRLYTPPPSAYTAVRKHPKIGWATLSS